MDKNNNKIPVGILGATGMVGQYYVSLLAGHPWFEVAYLAASPQSAGKIYSEAVRGRWHMSQSIPKPAAGLIVENVADIRKAAEKCRFVFSAFEMPDKEGIRQTESKYAAAGLPVVSNASAHRWTPDVPVFIPEINPDHTNLISIQQKNNNWPKGFIVAKPNCSLQTFLIPVWALQQSGFKVKKLLVTTLQALSGAGYPGPS